MCHSKLTLVKAGVPFNGVGETNRVVVASLLCELASSVRLTLSVTSKVHGRCGNRRSGDGAGLWHRAVRWLRRGRASQHDSLSNDERVFVRICIRHCSTV